MKQIQALTGARPPSVAGRAPTRVLCALALLLACCAPTSAEAPGDDPWTAITIFAEPAELGAESIGALTFRGGLELNAEAPEFGGLSGLEVLDNGTLIAVTDAGFWFSARLLIDDDETLIGLEVPRIAPMRDVAGDIFPDKVSADAEGLAQLPDGRFAVSFEQTQSIRIYDFNRLGPAGAAVPGPTLFDTDRLPPNQGLEAMAVGEAGELIIGAEGGWRYSTLWRALWDTSEPVPALAQYQTARSYALVGLDALPDGGFIALERAYAPGLGARNRITRFSAAQLQDGAIIEGEELARFARPLRLDNFEAISAVRNRDGATRLYIVSDNNFSGRQRTLLYAFDIGGE